jgi:hypothetical protein
MSRSTIPRRNNLLGDQEIAQWGYSWKKGTPLSGGKPLEPCPKNNKEAKIGKTSLILARPAGGVPAPGNNLKLCKLFLGHDTERREMGSG